MKSKIIKPMNIIKNDKNYRNFLKSIMKLRPSEEFLKRGLTETEVEEIVRPFYKTLTEVRLAGYTVWVQSNKLNIVKDIKRLKKNSSRVIAPDNALKAETFDNFVKAIKELKKSGLKYAMERYDEIAKKVYGDLKRSMYVRQYIKKNLRDLRKSIIVTDENESDSKDDNVSVHSMDSNDSRSQSSRLSQKIVEGFSNNARHSTPKRSRISPDTMEVDTDTLPQIHSKGVDAESKKGNDSGFNTNPTSSGIMTDISARSEQADGDHEQVETDLSTNGVQKKSETGPSFEVSSDAIAEDCSDDHHIPTADRAEAVSANQIRSNRDAHKRSSISKISKKTPKRFVQDEIKSPSDSGKITSSRNKRFKSATNEFAASPRSAEKNSYAYPDTSSANIRGNDDSERSDNFIALIRIDTNSLARVRKSSMSTDHDDFVTADECHPQVLNKENSGRDSGGSSSS
ncbi:uncharacterized protein LOC100120794 [Nasonia vitripennis]|uniref:Uncharacterized protein n=1 Tax=Nasonia vitripennis TaxID=7425 RepID=A0A7M7HAV1_NASVI|nr:uncharacterized protein LOC100120794 [Nasonia vitripennis]XP_008216938.2 uncharacterized protein LOC100120794 [Nasonia vitripennis]